MSLLTKAGISKLSELAIDTSKDWGAYLIKNLGLAVDDTDALRKAQAILESLLTTQGDIIHRGASKAERLGGSFGSGYNFLHGTNTGQYGVEWRDVQDLIIYLTGAVKRAVALPALQIPTPEVNLVVAEGHSGGGHPVPESLTIPLPVVSEPVLAATSVNAVGGAVAHDEDGEPADTDETIEANSAAINDMTLLQADGAVADWYALGYANLFDGIVLKVSTVGVDITLDTLEYSTGVGTWGTLTPILNQLNNYETLGKRWFTFERPGDWAVATYALIADKYWIKFKASAIGGGYPGNQPKGAQAWILVYP